MHKAVDDLLCHYETGRVSRRDLVAMLAALAAVPTLPAKAEATVLKAHSLNHASLIVSNVERSLKFYEDTFGKRYRSGYARQYKPNRAVPDLGNLIFVTLEGYNYDECLGDAD